MFQKHDIGEYSDPLPGIKRKTLVFGKQTLMTEFLLAGNSTLPEHAHPYEQTGCLVKGHMILKIGEEEHDTVPGDAWCIPMNVIHGARVIEDSIAIEVFSPVRADYLPGREEEKSNKEKT